MELSLFMVYVGAIGLLIFSPGPSAILCLNHGIKYGATKSIPAILGGCVAALFLMMLSAFGLGVLLSASATAFSIIKLLGAAYLIYLGVCIWRESGKSINISIPGSTHEVITKRQMFSEGFMVGVSNPKDIIFFAALFPNFVSIEQPQAIQFLLLTTTWFVIDFMAMFLYSSVGLKVAPLLQNKSNMLRFNRFIGGFFVTAGGLLAISHKKI